MEGCWQTQLVAPSYRLTLCACCEIGLRIHRCQLKAAMSGNGGVQAAPDLFFRPPSIEDLDRIHELEVGV